MNFRGGLVAIASTLAAVAAIPFTSVPAQAADAQIAWVNIGHRGTRVGAPEQTMAAFKYAADHGANFVEVDVRWTSDGSKRLMHDSTMDRTTNCTGSLETHTTAQVRACDAGTWYSSAFTGQKIPNLTDVLTYSKSRGMGVVVELKAYNNSFPDWQAKHTIAEIYKWGMQDKVYISSFSVPILQKVKALDTSKRLRYIVAAPSSTTYTAAKIRSFGFSNVSTLRTDLTASIVRSYHSGGVKVFPYAVRTTAEATALKSLGADGVFSDDPARS